MKRDNPARDLQALPNIGPEVARLLIRCGITSAEMLQRIGSVGAALRIREIRPDDPPCRSMLAGLEGAIRGVRWHGIPKDQREDLWNEYQQRGQDTDGNKD
jgi:DNA transformation protein